MEFPVSGITINPIIVVLWALFVGYVFSTVGAAGGILAGVGHITIFGMKNANMIKPMNQVLTLVSPMIAAPLYFRERRLVIPVAVALGVGGILGALLGSWLSHTFLADMKSYRPFFGFFTLIIAARIWQELTPSYQAKQKVVKEANKAFEAKVKELKACGQLCNIKEIGVEFNQLGIKNEFTFAGQTFRYNVFVPFVAGAIVAVISAALGVGGGFLLVPFLASVMGFPMFIVAGTSVLSILVSSAASIANYMRMGSVLDFKLLSFELVGVIVGSYLGPVLSKFIKGNALKIVLAIILTYIGVGYMFGTAIQAATGIKII